MNSKKGFTLIELLVVVAIIGVLASVVLASLNSARAKGSDAAIRANLANLRAQAEIYYDDTAGGNGKYGDGTNARVCTVTAAGVADAGCLQLFANTTFQAGMKAAAAASGATLNAHIPAAGDKWSASATLKTTADGNFCVDSSGNAKKNSSSQATGICS